MWPTAFFPDTYYTGTYWDKSGQDGGMPPVTTTALGASQYLPIMGVGSWLIAMIFS